MATKPEFRITEPDPGNGFMRVYQRFFEGNDYSLVRVPAGSYFRVEYVHPSADVDLGLEPVDANQEPWLVNGRINADVYEYLGLPLSAKRRMAGSDKTAVSVPPVITPYNLIQAGKYGLVTENPRSQDDHKLFDVDLELPPDVIARFLRRAWDPHSDPESELEQLKKQIRTSGSEGGDRLLPQRLPLRNKVRARLQVFNY